MAAERRNRLLDLGLCLAIASAWPVQAKAQDETNRQEQGDPAARAMLFDMATTLANLEDFSFDWVILSDDIADATGVTTYLQNGTTAMKRGVGLVVHSYRFGEGRSYYFDGETFTTVATDAGFYASAPFDGSYDQLVEVVAQKTGLSLPLWSLLSPTLPDLLRANVEMVELLGDTTLEGQRVHHLRFSGLESDWQLWVTDGPQALPLMILGTDRSKVGWPRYTARLSRWNTKANTPDNAFHFAPNAGLDPIGMPPLEEMTAVRPSANAIGQRP